MLTHYPECIKPAVKALCDELEKLFPGITNIEYEKGGDQWKFKERIEMALYFELIFSGKISLTSFFSPDDTSQTQTEDKQD